jgi:dUTP pyrophosphatase
MKILWTGEGTEPTMAHEGDAGFDLAYNGDTAISIAPNQTMNIPTGIKIQLPFGTWAMVTGRSSAFKRGLLTPLSVIDNGYRGDLFAIVRNISDQSIEVQPNERIAQLIVMPLAPEELLWVKVHTLQESARGENGFGSTGK